MAAECSPMFHSSKGAEAVSTRVSMPQWGFAQALRRIPATSNDLSSNEQLIFRAVRRVFVVTPYISDL